MTLKEFTNSRIFWLLLLAFSFGGLSVALIAEHVFDMQPCYLCIYQRIALLIVGIFSIITLMNPKNHILRKIGYLGWLSGAGLGLYSSIKLVHLQANPPMFTSCSMGANQLIETFGWLESLPMLFTPSGDCSSSSGELLGVTFEQWSLVLFALLSIYFVVIIGKRFLQRLK